MTTLSRAACLAIATSAVACATAPNGPASPPAVCVLDRPVGAPKPDADTWIALLLRGFDPHTRRVTSPPLDCTGHQVRWDVPVFRCNDDKATSTVVPERRLEAADVVVTPVSGDTNLVWIATSHFATGDAAGPVALVTTVGTQLRVTAMGSLRIYPERARLRLETLGGTKILVGDGERCLSDGSGCVRSSRLVPLRGARFEPMPLVGDDGRCVAPAWFDLARRDRRRASGGWEQLELTAALSFSPSTLGGLTVEEQVVVLDAAAGESRATARVLQRAQSTREVRWDGAHLVGTGTPLWSRITSGGRDLR
jgi:hypothetical protein